MKVNKIEMQKFIDICDKMSLAERALFFLGGLDDLEKGYRSMMFENADSVVFGGANRLIAVREDFASRFLEADSVYRGCSVRIDKEG